ncbi:glutamyl-tRNA ligase [Candidatus Magnetoovum chiemensis]|nr:glutamyl-tRNA ligase [Candidatus Magnetoovum chiemensis]
MSDTVRVRFAPSPTGFLHIGGARTALFNYLFARNQNGKFIFRIEDTDISRSTEEYIEAIIDGMKWLELDWDEGPFRQTDRAAVYEAYAKSLISQGKAYYCYCTPEEIEQKRAQAQAQKKAYKYDGKCKHLTQAPSNIKPTIRFVMPTEGTTEVSDLIKGRVSFDNSVLDDMIIVRSDGTATYNFVVVVDDIDMAITHIIRGDDHLNNTPKQIHIYNAFNAPLPYFAHLPMIMGADKTRLSKRHGATSVQAYREMGYLPQALINYLVRLGWSYKDQEIFKKSELIEKFTLDNIGKSASIFNPDKLIWLNAEYIKKSNPSDLIPSIMPFLIANATVDENNKPEEHFLTEAIITVQERAKTLDELAKALAFYLAQDVKIDSELCDKFLNDKTKNYLLSARDGIAKMDRLSKNELETLFTSLMKQFDAKLGEIAQPVRVALTASTASPSIFEIMVILGKEKTLRRINKAIEMVK